MPIVLRGSGDLPIPAKLKDVYTVRVRRDGSLVAAKWPKKRGKPKSDATNQQVATWDEVQRCILQVASKEYQVALETTSGTGLMPRDAMVMAAYGHRASYQGYGSLPEGPPPAPYALIATVTHRFDTTVTVLTLDTLPPFIRVGDPFQNYPRPPLAGLPAKITSLDAGLVWLDKVYPAGYFAPGTQVASPLLLPYKGAARKARPRAVGDPQPTNVVTSLDDDNDGTKTTITAKLCDDTPVELAIFCKAPTQVILYKRIKGKEQVHGLQQWIPETPQYFQPQAIGDREWKWEIPASAFPPNCKDCHYMLLLRAQQPNINWQSQLHPCPVSPTAAYWQDSADIEGPLGSIVSGSTTLLLAAWVFKDPAVEGGIVWRGTDNSLDVELDVTSGTNNLDVTLRSTAGTGTLNAGFSFAGLSDGWHSLLLSLDAATQQLQAYIDGADIGPPAFAAWGPGANIRWLGTENLLIFSIASDLPGQGVALQWFDLGQPFFDLTDPRNRARFFAPGTDNPGGDTVDWGVNGELPTGQAPSFYTFGGPANLLPPKGLDTTGWSMTGTFTDLKGP